MKYFKNTVFICLLVCSIIFAELLYAECDDIRPVESYRIKYRERGGNRCEGFYESDVSSGSLNVVGVVLEKFKSRFREKEKLTVSSPMLKERINIRAVGIPLKTYYRMDAEIGPNQRLEWPVDDVLRPQGLGHKDIGIFGWIRDKGEKMYIPVRVVSSILPDQESDSIYGIPHTALKVVYTFLQDIPGKREQNSGKCKAGNEGCPIYVFLRASLDVMNVRWRFADLAEDRTCKKSGEWIKPEKSRYYSGERIIVSRGSAKKPFCITVRADLAESSEGLLCEAKIFFKVE
jgi:hypothetical protein